VTDAYERLTGLPSAPLFLTCEHASERLPTGYVLSDSDLRLCRTHWAYDLGARDLVIELAAALGASAVLARYSRLLIDPNRDERHPDLFRQHAEGIPIAMNQRLSDKERQHRITHYHRPYHEAVDAALSQAAAPTLLSIHTFTPIYEGHVREVELGVLFDHDEAAAASLMAALRKTYPHVAANEPWSGKQGLIYSAERHAHRHGRVALELEVRQDLATDPAYRQELVQVLTNYFQRQ
jgi:predicted N-formylglutamate amidohydrolase